MKIKTTPPPKDKKGNRLHDRRPLVRNKTLYNRVIKSIINHKLEECLASESKLVILSELLTNMVYARQMGEISTLARINAMLRMLKKYTKKIIEDCRMFKLVPSAEFDPPEYSQFFSSPRQIVAELEKRWQDVIHVTPEGREFINITSDILEEIGKIVYKCTVSRTVNADKYAHVLDCANRWAESMKTRDVVFMAEIQTKKFNVKREKIKVEEKNEGDPLEDNDFEMTNHVSLSPERQNSLVMNVSHEELLKMEHPDEATAPEAINGNYLRVQGTMKSPYRSVENLSSSCGFNQDVANEKMVKLMMLMKQRDLTSREFDQKIFKVLDRYRNSRVGPCQKAN